MKKYSLKINKEKCKGCSLCVSVCPKKLLSISKNAPNKAGYYAMDIELMDECIGCLSCALMCPDGVIEIYER